MRQDQRQRVQLERTDVKKMDAQPVDASAILAKSVQPRLASPPVLQVAPVLYQGLDLLQGWPLARVRNGLPFGPARAPQPVVQLNELRLWNCKLERFDKIGQRMASSRR